MNNDPRFAYRESAARAATPVGRVILLYEQLVQDLGNAIAAMGQQDIERRTRYLDHALLVLGQLQASLDLDRGGDVARNLDRFYDLIRKRLVDAQVNGAPAVLREQMDLLLSVRSAWVEVEQQERRTTEAPPAEPPPPAPSADKGALRWRA